MLKKLLTLALAAGALAPALAQTSVGVSIGINQPGVYGRINLGNLPPPALILSQPVVIEQHRYVQHRSPVYLYVPPAHQQNWRQHCGRYNACNQPVYFVRDQWVRERYQAEHPSWNNGRHRGHDNNYRGDDRGRYGKSDDRGHYGRGDDDRGRHGKGDDDRGRNGKGDDRGRDGKGHDKGRN